MTIININRGLVNLNRDWPYIWSGVHPQSASGLEQILQKIV
jgi:hypothetical protein